jgi:hypothetical protein
MLGPRKGGSVMQRSHRARWAVATLGGLLAFAGVFVPSAAQAAGQPLIPIVHCVWTSDPVGPLAFFGYQNQDAVAVSVPVGTKNFLKSTPGPGPKNLGQPTVFAPGTTTDAFAVGLSSNPANTKSWTIKGPDGVVRTATTSISGPQCATEPFSPSISATGGDIGSKVTKQTYAADNTTLIGAKVQFKLTGLITTCAGGGVPMAPKITWYVSPWDNGTAPGKIKHLGVFPNDRDFAYPSGMLTIINPQAPPVPPHTTTGMSDGLVAADVFARCNLGNSIIETTGLIPIPRPPQPHSDAAPYCFITNTTAVPQVTEAGRVDVPAAPLDCPDVTTLPGGGVRWR